MLSTVLHAPGDIEVEERPEPVIHGPGDAIINVVAACICGSDLWGYRGIQRVKDPTLIGHELVGVVEEVGSEVTSVQPGDFVIAPFSLNCGHCQECRAGYPSACQTVTFYGSTDRNGFPVDGAQSSRVRIPYAQASLLPVGLSLAEIESRGLVPDLLTLSDVMSTGYHAAFAADVHPGDVVAVVGDGAVGLCAVIAAKLLGASRIIAMSRHDDRAALAREFGATDVIAERGADAADAVRALLDGDLADVALECVGTKESMEQAFAVTRGGGKIGFVGVPAGGPALDIDEMFAKNIGVNGGMAPARRHMETLLPLVLDGTIHPGKVFTLTLPLSDAAEGYRAMDERRAIKVLLRP